jgi:hypothetical protein
VTAVESLTQGLGGGDLELGWSVPVAPTSSMGGLELGGSTPVRTSFLFPKSRTGSLVSMSLGNLQWMSQVMADLRRWEPRVSYLEDRPP